MSRTQRETDALGDAEVGGDIAVRQALLAQLTSLGAQVVLRVRAPRRRERRLAAQGLVESLVAANPQHLFDLAA
jgi:hypothetical protein